MVLPTKMVYFLPRVRSLFSFFFSLFFSNSLSSFQFWWIHQFFVEIQINIIKCIIYINCPVSIFQFRVERAIKRNMAVKRKTWLTNGHVRRKLMKRLMLRKQFRRFLVELNCTIHLPIKTIELKHLLCKSESTVNQMQFYFLFYLFIYFNEKCICPKQNRIDICSMAARSIVPIYEIQWNYLCAVDNFRLTSCTSSGHQIESEKKHSY